jgi:hypothetical protein
VLKFNVLQLILSFLPTIFKEGQEVGWGGMDWIDLAEERERWQALVNVVMNLWMP